MNEKNGDRGGRHAPPFICLKSGERFRVRTNTLMDRVDEFEPPSRVQGYVTRVAVEMHNVRDSGQCPLRHSMFQALTGDISNARIMMPFHGEDPPQERRATHDRREYRE